MKCRSCGAPLPEQARFCAQCAAPVPARNENDDPVRDALAKALGTHYRILRLLGRGGMGAVYLAHEDGLERDVAIKVLPPERASSAELRERFKREARTAARLTHPNVVPLHTFGEVEGMLYYVMGYVPGESLAAHMGREGRLPESETRRLLVEIAGALEYAHQLGVVHRDIKPDNILLEAGSGRPLLTDFGIAKALAAGESLTSTGSIIGTPSYMSPEQASGKGDVDARSDLYSLGVMAYAMLSGRLPFEGKTPADVLVQHMTRPASPLGPLAPSVSDTLGAAVMRCLEKDPARRWARAIDLAAALRPSADDPDALPGELEALDSRGLAMLLFLFYGLLVAGYGFYFSSMAPKKLGVRPFAFGPLPPFTVFVTLFMTGILGLSIVRPVVLGRRRGFSWKSILAAALRHPVGWPLWYPRSLRRPSNVWDRLPRPARTARAVWSVAATASTLVLPFLLWTVAYSVEFPREAQRDVGGARVFGFAALLSAAALVFGAGVWARRALQSAALDQSLLTESFLIRAPLSATTFWSRPEVAALLTPAPVDQAAAPRFESAAPTTQAASEAATLER